jgi:hypothetical protein
LSSFIAKFHFEIKTKEQTVVKHPLLPKSLTHIGKVRVFVCSHLVPSVKILLVEVDQDIARRSDVNNPLSSVCD